MVGTPAAARGRVLQQGESRKRDRRRRRERSRGGGQGGYRGWLGRGRRGRVRRPRDRAVGGDVALARDENETAPEAAGWNRVRRVGDQGTTSEDPCRDGVRRVGDRQPGGEGRRRHPR
jgi:hypothetical protein